MNIIPYHLIDMCCVRHEHQKPIKVRALGRKVPPDPKDLWLAEGIHPLRLIEYIYDSKSSPDFLPFQLNKFDNF